MKPIHERIPVLLEIGRQMAEHPERYALADLGDDARLDEWGGSVLLVFPELERDGEEIVTDPLVRSFVRHLFGEVPHLLYLLAVSPASHTAVLVFCAYAPDDRVVDDGSGPLVGVDEHVSEAVAQRMVAALDVARRRGEDWRTLLAEYAGGGFHDQAARAEALMELRAQR